MTNAKQSHGFGTLEILLSLTLFTFVAIVYMTVSTQLYDGARYTYERAHARILAQEGITALLSLRNQDFDLLASGQHGLVFENGSWLLTAEPTQRGPFTHTILISEETDEKVYATSSVSWGGVRHGSIELPIVLTDIFETHGVSEFIVSDNATAVWNMEGNEIQNISIENTDTTGHEVTMLTLTWSGAAGLWEVTSGSSTLYSVATSSAASSGETVDISDLVLEGGEIAPVSFLFTEAVTDPMITLQMSFEDMSKRSVVHEIE